jgi:proline racemase
MYDLSRLRSCAAVLLLAAAGAASAHHSFAVFFDSERTVSVRGPVTDFQFRNPHGLIRISVTGENGEESVWKAETNSPSILARRGWKKDTLKAGEVITMEGWPTIEPSARFTARSRM